MVIRDYDDEHQVAWLAVGNPVAQWDGADVTIHYANGEDFSLAKCWRNDAPPEVASAFLRFVTSHPIGPDMP